MKFIKERHLRVKSPITIDGLTLAYDSFQRPRYSITHLPITAQKHLEKSNKKLPPHLKKIIEVVDPIETPEQPKPALPPMPTKFDDIENEGDDEVATKTKTAKK